MLATHQVYLPDIAGWRLAHVPEQPRERPVGIAPDWVCEILSPSTADRDIGHKLHTYHAARVDHYWVVERYLAPILAEVEREPDDPDRIAEILRHALAVARGETQPLTISGGDSADRVSEEYLEGIRGVLRLARMAWRYEAVVAAFEELSAKPSAAEYKGNLMRDRLIVANWYERPDEELDALLQTALRVFEGEPVRSRMSTMSSACVGRPVLAAKYVPPLITEFEEELRRDPEQVGGNLELAMVKRSYERTMAGK